MRDVLRRTPGAGLRYLVEQDAFAAVVHFRITAMIAFATERPKVGKPVPRKQVDAEALEPLAVGLIVESPQKLIAQGAK